VAAHERELSHGNAASTGEVHGVGVLYRPAGQAERRIDSLASALFGLRHFKGFAIKCV